MNFYDQTISHSIKRLNSDKYKGLSKNSLEENRKTFGENVITEKKSRSIFGRIADALKEPMLLILLFGFVITFGANLGKYIKSGEGDFVDCFGILFAVILSVAITVVMEGSSQKAFIALNKIYEHINVKVIRQGELIVVDKSLITVGDILIIESGDKIVADGRLIESVDLIVDESSLTGESIPCKKDSSVVLPSGIALAERKNMLFSGSFVTGGSGKMLVTAVGDMTEMGKIAGEISKRRQDHSPLQHKLSKLGKMVTIIGAICAVVILAISMVRLIITGSVTFSNVQDLFISCIVLIVAAVPEGLPTIVAVCLALNMIKLAKENALIKKMTATETAGAVSIICSDKTGTLTENQMKVTSVCTGEYCITPKRLFQVPLLQNFVCNNTANIIKQNKKIIYKGSGTECALLKAYQESNPSKSYSLLRQEFESVYSIPFSSEKKCMLTVINNQGGYRSLVKGAPEVILSLCNLSEQAKAKINKEILSHQQKAERILCFAHFDGVDYSKEITDKSGQFIYDGFVALKDPLRKDVKKAVADCNRAGIKVKILTGDNIATAFAIAKELGIAKEETSVINATDVEKLSDEDLIKILPKITVIARSTPIVKLRVVKLLKSMGEVVAVTGDGINDAPAIRHADVGIAMGINGSDITKETADVVLLDDSFTTVVKTVSFGRNVYRNLQRFILFQLSVNVSALLFITICAILGLPSPFNTLQLLWINVIMDGPPALTLGLEQSGDKLMTIPPVKRKQSIVNKKMLYRITFNGVFVCGVMLLQLITNFLGARHTEQGACVFTLFILFQLFNAFNSKELGTESIFKSVGKNKIMLWAFGGVFFFHVLIVTFFSGLFGIKPMRFILWLKCILVASTIILIVETYKIIYKKFVKGRTKRVKDK